jgi:raffinose/stachyose/melibiose transport system substrate-binding protein
VKISLIKTGKSALSRTALLAAVAAAATGLAACSSSGASSSSANVAAAAKPASGCPATASITIWGLVTSTAQEATDAAAATAFEKACPGSKINYQYYTNENLKQKITTALAAGNGPTLFQNQGGSQIQPYVADGKVVDLSAGLAKADPAWKSKLLASSLTPATITGGLYGFPVFGAEPMLLFYNKSVFQKLGITPPTNLTELTADVKKIKAAGIIPVAIGQQDVFPATFWLQYLVDRAGGAAPFNAVVANKPDAWSNPAIMSGLDQLQSLVKDGIFGTGYNSVGEVSGAATALLYTGRAAMKVDGTWILGEIQAADPGFLQANELGFTQFPAGSSGDNVYGTASSLYSLTSSATSAQRAVAYAFMTSELTSKAFAQRQIAVGVVPAVTGVASMFPDSLSGQLGKFSYQVAAQNGSSFQTNWNSALGTLDDTLQSNAAAVTSLALTPSGFVSRMNATLQK